MHVQSSYQVSIIYVQGHEAISLEGCVLYSDMCNTSDMSSLSDCRGRLFAVGSHSNVQLRRD